MILSLLFPFMGAYLNMAMKQSQTNKSGIIYSEYSYINNSLQQNHRLY